MFVPFLRRIILGTSIIILLVSILVDGFSTTSLPATVRHKASHRVTVPKLHHLVSRKCDCEDIEAKASLSSRRRFAARSFSLCTTLLILNEFIPASTILPPPAYAAYGDAAKTEGFDTIQFLIEKNKVANPDDSLYKGADAEVQIKRIADAAKRLEEIPDIVQNKKWSQVQGLLTGPLGTLLQTINTLVKASSAEQAKTAAAKVKVDLNNISQQALKKNDVACIQATTEALRDLQSFTEIIF